VVWGVNSREEFWLGKGHVENAMVVFVFFKEPWGRVTLGKMGRR